MRRANSMIWMLASAAAALCAALTVTLADASEQQPAASSVRWSAEEKTVLASLSLRQLPLMPPDPSNAVEQRPAAIDLGRRLFSDARLSRNGAVSCATCHDPAKQFQDGLPVSQGVGTGSRNTLAFMFESRHVFRPTAQALAAGNLQVAYDAVWQGFLPGAR